LPEFLPFAGVRYNCRAAGTELGKLAAPPYDVVDTDERAALAAMHPNNSVRLILPLDEDEAGDRYRRAAAAFAKWLRAGILFEDDHPRFYGYRMQYRDSHGRERHTAGVLGALGLPDGEGGTNSDILPHERTMPKAKSDRLALLSTMRVNVDPIWGLTAGSGLTALLADASPLDSCTDNEGVRHELFAIDDPARIAAITEIVAGAPLVLADGHHRFETAINYRNELRAADEPLDGAVGIMAFVVELVEDELCIEPIHRVAEAAADIDVRARLADAFEIEPMGDVTPENVEALELAMADRRALGLVDTQGLALAIPRADVRAAALADEHPVVAETDAATVEALVVPRLPEATWQYRHDAAACAALVDKRAASFAILCSPVTVAQTRAAALDGARMPQKTTFFWPKPRTGMVFRTLD